MKWILKLTKTIGLILMYMHIISKRIIVEAKFVKEEDVYKTIEIQSGCIESMEKINIFGLDYGCYLCRTISGQEFIITKNAHDSIIEKEGGIV